MWWFSSNDWCTCWNWWHISHIGPRKLGLGLWHENVLLQWMVKFYSHLSNSLIYADFRICLLWEISHVTWSKQPERIIIWHAFTKLKLCTNLEYLFSDDPVSSWLSYALRWAPIGLCLVWTILDRSCRIYLGSEIYDLTWIVNLYKPYSWSSQTGFPQYSRHGIFV